MFYGMMRVRNEARWIRRSIESLLKVCESVLVLDDHSTDGTQDILCGIDRCTALSSPFAGLNESRDKTWLLERIVESVGLNHWIICIDGDEEICDWETLMETGHTRHGGYDPVSYSFQILTLYDSPNQIRADPPYNNLLRPSMFRLLKPGMVFKSNGGHGGGFHCSNVPADIGYGITLHEPPVRVKHYGYMEKADRERKYKFYVENDSGHEDWYRRECFGVPELVELPEGL